MTTMTAFSEELARLRARRVTSTRRPLLVALAVMAASLVAALPRARTAVMSVAGFGCVVAGVWTSYGPGAGLAATGVAVLALEYLADGEGGRRR